MLSKFKNVRSNLVGLDSQSATFIEYGPTSGKPVDCWDYYEADGIRDIDATVAFQWYRSGSAVGVRTDASFYAVRFHRAKLRDVEEAVALALLRDHRPGQSTPIFGNGDGEFIVLLGKPENARMAGYKNLIRGIQAPGATVSVDLHWGPNTSLKIIDPASAPGGFEPVSEWVNPPVVHPRAWVNEPNLIKKAPPMIQLHPTREKQIKYGIAHLRLLQASLKPTDNLRQVVTDAAADLVVGLSLDPYDAFELMTRPLGRRWTGSSFLDSVLPNMSAKHRPTREAMIQMCEDAVDGVSPMAMKAWRKADAELKVAEFARVLRHLPPSSKETLITAGRFRAIVCELLGIDPADLNQKVFGETITVAIEAMGLLIKRDRFPHPVYGNQTIYRGVNPASLRNTWHWWKDKLAAS